MKTFRIISLLCTLIMLLAAGYKTEAQDMPLDQHGDNRGHSMAHSPLTAPGNDAFGAIQEAIRELDADPKTDWSSVNLEGLRLHLVDMHNFTINVEVLSQRPIENGFEAVIRPTTKISEASLDRVLAVHPMQMKKETGWEMKVSKKGDLFTLKVTTSNPAEISRLRGLGYIGIMAVGEHHQGHHWGMVKGSNPHN
jgi:hypothetical protein